MVQLLCEKCLLVLFYWPSVVSCWNCDLCYCQFRLSVLASVLVAIFFGMLFPFLVVIWCRPSKDDNFFESANFQKRCRTRHLGSMRTGSGQIIRVCGHFLALAAPSWSIFCPPSAKFCCSHPN